jgi:hypothetical protein
MPRRSNAAKNNPVIARKTLDAGAQDLGGDGMLEIPTTGDARIIETIVPADPGGLSTSKADMLQFMAETVRVRIDDVSDEQADPYFGVSVNGRTQIFHRGQEYNVPRFIIEGLARAKPTGYKNEEYVQADGVRAIRNPIKRGLRYPFSVVEDTPKGRDWLRQVLKQP